MGEMPPLSSRPPRPWAIPLRVLLLTVIFTLLLFAVVLLLAILGIVIWSAIHGTHPNVTTAYRVIAAPVAAVAVPLILIAALISELRYYRQAKVLAAIERLR